jgi:hypothetical protein
MADEFPYNLLGQEFLPLPTLAGDSIRPPQPAELRAAPPPSTGERLTDWLYGLGAPRHTAERIGQIAPWTPMGGAFDAGQLIGEGINATNPAQIGLGTGLAGLAALPLGVARTPVRIPNPIRAYHGSPSEFDRFVTPAFFSRSEREARRYRDEGGSGYNFNGMAGDIPPGWYYANRAFDEAGQDRIRAIALLRSAIESASGRPGEIMPRLAAIEHLQAGRPLGRIYEAQLPGPTAHYNSEVNPNQDAILAHAIARGHNVITMGDHIPGTASEIIALNPDVIAILRRYGWMPPVAAPILNGLAEQPPN